ncbi:hypothetical protein [Brucella gallinifaecis]|uniref:hypothetical protein n=1 Tax=Brucella gallinifaecis TaxID=215590 RepID=UPI00235FB6B8|nr:hypothetical protein [Brucella gallinifaecis]
MAPVIIKSEDIDDDSKSWKTYYLKVTYQNEIFYKIGVCKGSVKQRYKKESADLLIEILKLWKFDTESAAYKHEGLLFKQYPGDRPYYGKCGPFYFGGNTETYSHDVMNDEKPPLSFEAKLYSLSEIERIVIGYPDRNPLLSFKHLYGTVNYMETMWGPPQIDEGVYLQVPTLSSSKKVVLATVDYLEDRILPERSSSRIFPKRDARDALERSITVRSWSDYSDMKFEGLGFK